MQFRQKMLPHSSHSMLGESPISCRPLSPVSCAQKTAAGFDSFSCFFEEVSNKKKTNHERKSPCLQRFKFVVSVFGCPGNNVDKFFLGHVLWQMRVIFARDEVALMPSTRERNRLRAYFNLSPCSRSPCPYGWLAAVSPAALMRCVV
jgi:hypothetical protein